MNNILAQDQESIQRPIFGAPRFQNSVRASNGKQTGSAAQVREKVVKAGVAKGCNIMYSRASRRSAPYFPAELHSYQCGLNECLEKSALLLPVRATWFFSILACYFRDWSSSVSNLAGFCSIQFRNYGRHKARFVALKQPLWLL